MLFIKILHHEPVLSRGQDAIIHRGLPQVKGAKGIEVKGDSPRVHDDVLRQGGPDTYGVAKPLATLPIDMDAKASPLPRWRPGQTSDGVDPPPPERGEFGGGGIFCRSMVIFCASILLAKRGESWQNYPKIDRKANRLSKNHIDCP